MRILHLGKYYAPQRGGIERHTQALAEAYARTNQLGSALPIHDELAMSHRKGDRLDEMASKTAKRIDKESKKQIAPQPAPASAAPSSGTTPPAAK